MEKSASSTKPVSQDLYLPNNSTIIEEQELSYDEHRQREYLERIVERSVFEAGKALRELRDFMLYRSTHKTFEEYCQDRFGFTRIAAMYKIAAVTVLENLLTNGYQNSNLQASDLQEPNLLTNGYQNPDFQSGDPQELDLLTNGYQILPINERQVRPLVPLEPAQQREAWKLAVEAAGGKVPSGRIVKNVVDRIKERTKVPNPYRLGEVCIFIPKDNPELKGKSGCWGIVTNVGDFSCTVETWDGEYTAKIENLKSLEMTDNDCKFMQNLCLRLQKLHKIPNLDFTINSFLACVGKQCNPYLTLVQKKVIETIEFHYNVPNITLVA